MNKKKLPRAVLRTADEMREAGAAAAATSSDNVITMTPKPDASMRGTSRQPTVTSAPVATWSWSISS